MIFHYHSLTIITADMTTFVLFEPSLGVVFCCAVVDSLQETVDYYSSIYTTITKTYGRKTLVPNQS